MKNTLKTMVDVLIGALLAAFVALAVALVGIPAAFNGTNLTVLTGSMEPVIHPGDVVVVKRIDNTNMSELGVGDVISFLPFPDDPTVVTHRIIAVTNSAEGRSFITQGDANNQVDYWGPVLDDHVRGKLMYVVPKIGFVKQWLAQNFTGFGTIAGIGLIGAGLLSFAWSFRKKRKNAPQPDQGPNHNCESVNTLVTPPITSGAAQ